MARSFQTPGDTLTLADTFSHPKGSIVLTIKPTWTGFDGLRHNFFKITGPSATLHFYKGATPNEYGNESIIGGIYLGATQPPPNDVLDRRCIIPSSYLGFSPNSLAFISGEEATWIVQWDATEMPPLSTLLYKNAIDIAGVFASNCYLVPWTMPTFTSLTIGDATYPPNADMSEYARFDYILTPRQREIMLFTGPGSITPPPVHYVPILGMSNPEPAVIGPDLIVVGSPLAAPHPVARELPDHMGLLKPPPGTPIRYENDITDNLVMCFPFNEGVGNPREQISNALPANVQTILDGIAWPADKSCKLHYADIHYPTTVFDNLSSFTICAGFSIDLYQAGPVPPAHPGFPFPNQPTTGFVGKQIVECVSQGEISESSWAIEYQHGDEIEGSAGGRDEFWCVTGKGEGEVNPGGGFPEAAGIDTWYMFRVSGLDWQNTPRQLFWMYDKDAPAALRWTCRVNGIYQYPADIYIDAPLALPATTAPLMIGASYGYPYVLNGGYSGGLQYLYFWNTAKPDVWEPLLYDPYAFFKSENVATINGVAFRKAKLKTGTNSALVRGYNGVA